MGEYAVTMTVGLVVTVFHEGNPSKNREARLVGQDALKQFFAILWDLCGLFEVQHDLQLLEGMLWEKRSKCGERQHNVWVGCSRTHSTTDQHRRINRQFLQLGETLTEIEESSFISPSGVTCVHDSDILYGRLNWLQRRYEAV